MLRKVYFHGSLKLLCPDPIEVDTETVAEALKAISVQIPALGPDPINGKKRVAVVGCDTIEQLFSYSDQQEIHVVPQFCGGKNGGFIQVGIGALLIAASFLLSATPLAPLAPLLFKVGALLIIGGLLQIISAPKRDNKDKEEHKSHYLGAPRNTVEIGTRVPILYGRRRIGGHFLSFNISSVNTYI